MYLLTDSCPLPSGGGRVKREDHGVRLILYPRENLLIRLPPAHRPMIPFSHLHTTRDNKYGIKKSILSVRPTVHTIKKKHQLFPFFWAEFFENALRDIFSESILHFFDQKDAPSFKFIGRQIF